MNILKEGWVVITPTICQGDIMAWSTEDGKGNDLPDVYETKEDAWREIAETMVIELQQFIDEERELKYTDFDTQDYVVMYQEDKDGTIIVSDEEGDTIIKTTLEEWRKNR